MEEKSSEIEKEAYKQHAQVCSALANPKRLEIIDLLGEGERSVEELTEAMGIRKPNVSQHLAVLRQNSLVDTRRDGRRVFYRISDSRVIEACRTMREITLDRLAEGQELIQAADENSREG